MADETTPNSDEQKPKSKLPMKTLLVVLGVMFLEGAAISVFWVVKGGPAPAEATDPIAETIQGPNKDMVEVELTGTMTVDNYSLGKTRMVITLEVVAKTERANQEQLKQAVDEHKTEIKDTVRELVSAAEPTDIRDSSLEVIKREIKTGTEKIIAENLIEEILLPVWQSYTTD